MSAQKTQRGFLKKLRNKAVPEVADLACRWGNHDWDENYRRTTDPFVTYAGLGVDTWRCKHCKVKQKVQLDQFGERIAEPF